MNLTSKLISPGETIMRSRQALLAAIAVSGTLAALPQAAGASTLPAFPTISGSTPAASSAAAGLGNPNGGNTSVTNGTCGASVAGGGGTAGYTSAMACDSGLVFIGPAVGQVATVIGPTIISAAVVGNSFITSAGPATGS